MPCCAVAQHLTYAENYLETRPESSLCTLVDGLIGLAEILSALASDR